MASPTPQKAPPQAVVLVTGGTGLVGKAIEKVSYLGSRLIFQFRSLVMLQTGAPTNVLCFWALKTVI
jgi:hypothetical protein